MKHYGHCGKYYLKLQSAFAILSTINQNDGHSSIYFPYLWYKNTGAEKGAAVLPVQSWPTAGLRRVHVAVHPHRDIVHRCPLHRATLGIHPYILYLVSSPAILVYIRAYFAPISELSRLSFVRKRVSVYTFHPSGR